jgi:hypothetical protein
MPSTDIPSNSEYPVIVILDAEGKQLTTKDSSELEEGDHHSPAKGDGLPRRSGRRPADFSRARSVKPQKSQREGAKTQRRKENFAVAGPVQ